MSATSYNKEYEIPPSAPSKLPLVASSRRQLLIFLGRYVQDKARFYRKFRPKKPGLHAKFIRKFNELE